MSTEMEPWEQYDLEERTGVVHCDENCRAKQNPESYEELQASLEHWKSHSYLSGCSHAN